MATCWIGTSGFNYKHWAGSFYPAGLPPSQWLRFYAQQFDSVELNVTFYRLPQPASFRTWHRSTGPEFRFVIKGSRFVTHIKRLREAQESVPRLMNASKPLLEKRSCVLWQLPPQMKIDVEPLKNFTQTLQDNEHARQVRHAFEFRHTSWFAPEVSRVLRDHNMALVLADMPFEVIPEGARPATTKPLVRAAPTADWWYIRRHGPTGVHTGYSDEQVRQDAEWVTRALDQKHDVFVYYNNDVNTHAPRDALRLRQLVTRRGIAKRSARRTRQEQLGPIRVPRGPL